MVNSLHSDSNASLYPGQSLFSDNGRARFIAQQDGNLVVYSTAGGGSPLWTSRTAGKHLNRATMNVNGEVCAFTNDGGGDTSWKSGSWNSGKPGPYNLVMQNDGNLVAYASSGEVIWETGTRCSPAPIPFSRIKFVNNSPGATVYPMTKDDSGFNTWSNPRQENSYWMIAEGVDKTVFWDTDTTEGKKLSQRYKDGTVMTLGFNVVVGDDDWIDPFKKFQFVYKKDSNICVTIRKWGGLLNGDAEYDGSVSF